MHNKFNFVKGGTTIEGNKFGDILVDLSIITEEQLHEALIAQKQLLKAGKQLTIGQVISVLYQIDFEIIEKIFVKEFLAQGIKKIIKNILINDKYLNIKLKNSQKSIDDFIGEKCLEVKIVEWSRKIIKIIEFKEDQKAIYKDEIFLGDIEGIFEIILNIPSQKISCKTDFIYDIGRYLVNITAWDITALLRQDIINCQAISKSEDKQSQEMASVK